MLSTIKLSKDEIIQNLKEKYKEKDIIDAISFLKKNNLLNEYLGIPNNQDGVVIVFWPRDLKNRTTSKKFYMAYIEYGNEIGRVAFKKLKDSRLSYLLHICSEPLTFYDFNEISKGSWNFSELEPLMYKELQIYGYVFNRFMSDTCVVEASYTFELFYDYEKKFFEPHSEPVSEIIKHPNSKQMKKLLLKRYLTKIKQFGAKNIIVKDDDGIHIGVKYTLPKEVILPLITGYRVGHCGTLFPRHIVQKQKGENRSETWCLTMGFPTYSLIRNRKKNEDKYYFFIDDESEDLDGIIMDEFEFALPISRQTEFVEYITKKYKEIGINSVRIKFKRD